MESIEKLVNEAHKIFNQTSVFEVVDIDRQKATVFLQEAYDNPPRETVDRYLSIAAKLKMCTS